MRSGIASRDLVSTYAARLSGVVLNMVSSILTARFLGPEGRGLLATSQTAIQVGTQFGTMGLQATFCMNVAKDASRTKDAVMGSLLAGSGIGILVAVLIWGMDVLGIRWFPLPPHLLLITLFCIPLGLANTLLNGVLQGRSMFGVINGCDILQRLAGVGFLLVLALVGWMSAGAVIGFGAVLGSVVVASVVLVVLEGKLGSLGGGFRLLRESARYSYRSWAASVASFLLLRSPILLVQHGFPKDQVGIFAIAMSIFDILLILPQSMATILFPGLVSMESSGSRRRATDRAILASVAAVAAAGGSILLVGELAIEFVFGPEFRSSYPVLLALIPGLVAVSGIMILNQRLASEGMGWITSAAPLAGALAFWIWRVSSDAADRPDLVSIARAASICFWLVFVVLFLHSRKVSNHG